MSKYWLGILTELKNRGVVDIFYLVCDGLKGMPDSVGTVFPQAIVQTCVVHLIRNTFKYASKRYWGELSKDVKAIYTAPDADAAWAAFETQGHGKVAFLLVSRLMILSGLRLRWRSAAVMLVAPARLSRLMAVFLRVAMTRGAWPVRTWEWSSA